MDFMGLINIPDWLIVVCIIFAAIHVYMSWNYGFWESQILNTIKPFPIIGSPAASLTESMAHCDLRNCKKYGKVYGLYEFRNPYLMIHDLDLVKQFLIKDFNNFADRRDFALGGKSRITRGFLVHLRGDEWRSARATLTPTFTSGKLRQMFEMMDGSAVKMVKSFCDDVTKQDGVMNVKNRFDIYTTDVIATCCFGSNIKIEDPNDPFVRHANKMVNSDFIVVGLLSVLFPKLVELFELSLFPSDSLAYFEKVVLEVVKIRRSENTRRNDFLQLLLDAQESEKEGKMPDDPDKDHNADEYETKNWKHHKVLDENGLVANAILFLLAGFETTATTISIAAYLLALNPECQQQLIEEINQAKQSHDKLPNDVILSLPYLEKVLSETLRMYPPSIRLERMCTHDCKLGDVNIRKGMLAAVGIYAIHHDPELYPEPEKFDPERFSPENKAQRHPMAYLPFGTGPRHCIGMRFALMEAKICLAHFFSEFKVSPCDKTEIPLKMRIGTPVLIPINGVTLKVEPIH